MLKRPVADEENGDMGDWIFIAMGNPRQAKRLGPRRQAIGNLSPNPPKGCDREGQTGGKRGGSEITGLDTDRNGLLPGMAITGRGFLTARSANGGEISGQQETYGA